MAEVRLGKVKHLSQAPIASIAQSHIANLHLTPKSQVLAATSSVYTKRDMVS